MSDLRNALTKGLSNPQSLKQQADVRGYFLDDHSQAQSNEPNMLTFLTMRDLFKTNDGTSDEEKAIGATAREESKYLLTAMKILQSDDSVAENKKFKDKFGKDLKGASDLAQVLKTEAIKREYENDLDIILSKNTILGRKALGALRP